MQTSHAWAVYTYTTTVSDLIKKKTIRLVICSNSPSHLIAMLEQIHTLPVATTHWKLLLYAAIFLMFTHSLRQTIKDLKEIEGVHCPTFWKRTSQLSLSWQLRGMRITNSWIHESQDVGPTAGDTDGRLCWSENAPHSSGHRFWHLKEMMVHGWIGPTSWVLVINSSRSWIPYNTTRQFD